jgi:hypothetical protein
MTIIMQLAHSVFSYEYFVYLLHPMHVTCLLIKLIVTQIIKEFSAFYGTRSFITVFTKTQQFAPSIPISLRSILMLSSHLRLCFS